MNEKTRTHCSPSRQYIHSSVCFNCRSCHFFRTPWIDSRSLNIYIHSLTTRTTGLCLSGARGWVGGGGGSSLQDCLPFLVCPPQAIQTKAAACEGLATRLCRNIRTWLTKLRYNHSSRMLMGCVDNDSIYKIKVCLGDKRWSRSASDQPRLEYLYLWLLLLQVQPWLKRLLFPRWPHAPELPVFPTVPNCRSVGWCLNPHCPLLANYRQFFSQLVQVSGEPH